MRNSWLKVSLRFTGYAAAISLTASACQHNAKDPMIPVNPTPAPASDAKPVSVSLPKLPTPFAGVFQITQAGENSSARFSADGTHIIYVSRGRSNHKQSQVYEMMFPQMSERRLTFHDGDDLDPVIAPDGAHFYYSSTTDELKDEKVATDKLMRTYYPQGLGKEAADKISPQLLAEIYLQEFNGREIERLTDSAGFDGEVDVEPKTEKRIVFTSSRDGAYNVFIGDRQARGVRRLANVKAADRGARFSPDGKTLVWSRTSPDAKTTQLILSEEPFHNSRELMGITGLILQPTWHANGTEIVFSAKLDGDFYNLYSVDRIGQCLRRLTTMKMDQTQPAVSPDGKRILFTGRPLTSAGQPLPAQIYAVDIKASGPCLQVPRLGTTSDASPTVAPATASKLDVKAEPTSSPVATPTSEPTPAPKRKAIIPNPTPMPKSTPNPTPTPAPALPTATPIATETPRATPEPVVIPAAEPRVTPTPTPN